jgi:hypothetical protein
VPAAAWLLVNWLQVISHHDTEHKASIAALQYHQFAVRHYCAEVPEN